jgi:hypothetical protein
VVSGLVFLPDASEIMLTNEKRCRVISFFFKSYSENRRMAPRFVPPDLLCNFIVILIYCLSEEHKTLRNSGRV